MGSRRSRVIEIHVYVDWTEESIPRPYYVGIGSLSRTRSTKRNWTHRKTRKLLGHNRTIELSTLDRDKACALERQLIAEFHTFIDDPIYNGIGANLTPGGDHPGKMSISTRRKMSESRMGERNPNWGGNKITDETRRRMSEAARNRPPISEKTRQRLRARPVTKTTREKLRKAVRYRAKTNGLEWNRVHKRSVIQLDTQGNEVNRFDSIKTAAEKTKTSRSLISQVLNGHRDLAKGFGWIYAE